MRRTELRKVIKTCDQEELGLLYALYVETDQEERLVIIEQEERRRKNPNHRNKVLPRKTGLKERLA